MGFLKLKAIRRQQFLQEPTWDGAKEAEHLERNNGGRKGDRSSQTESALLEQELKKWSLRETKEQKQRCNNSLDDAALLEEELRRWSLQEKEKHKENMDYCTASQHEAALLEQELRKWSLRERKEISLCEAALVEEEPPHQSLKLKEMHEQWNGSYTGSQNEAELLQQELQKWSLREMNDSNGTRNHSNLEDEEESPEMEEWEIKRVSCNSQDKESLLEQDSVQWSVYAMEPECETQGGRHVRFQSLYKFSMVGYDLSSMQIEEEEEEEESLNMASNDMLFYETENEMDHSGLSDDSDNVSEVSDLYGSFEDYQVEDISSFSFHLTSNASDGDGSSNTDFMTTVLGSQIDPKTTSEDSCRKDQQSVSLHSSNRNDKESLDFVPMAEILCTQPDPERVTSVSPSHTKNRSCNTEKGRSPQNNQRFKQALWAWDGAY